jgi:hypothetical protein
MQANVTTQLFDLTGQEVPCSILLGQDPGIKNKRRARKASSGIMYSGDTASSIIQSNLDIQYRQP